MRFLFSAALLAAVQDPGFRGKIADLGAQALSAHRARPEPLRTHLGDEIAKWTPVIKKAGIYAN